MIVFDYFQLQKFWSFTKIIICFGHTAWAILRDKYVQNEKSYTAHEKGGDKPLI